MTHALLCLTLAAIQPTDPQIDSASREVKTSAVAKWDFAVGPAGWQQQNQCELMARDGLLRVRSTGHDPFFHRRVDLRGGHLLLRLRYRTDVEGDGAVYWATATSPRGEDKAARFPLVADSRWHTAEVRFAVDGRLNDLRIDPGSGPGKFDIDALELLRETHHPLAVSQVEQVGKTVRFTVTTDRPEPVSFAAGGRSYRIKAGDRTVIERPVIGRRPVEALTVDVKVDRWPLLRRTVMVANRHLRTDWIVREQRNYVLRVAADGSSAQLTRAGQVVAVVAPLVHCQGEIPNLRLVRQNAQEIGFEGEKIRLTIAPREDELSVVIDSQQPCTGPVVRVVGELQQALCAGVEYLGKGEVSSSALDIETNDRFRFAPDPLHMTMPLMAYVTDRTSIAISWDDMELQPLFATPNQFDGSDDHYMALRGTQISATIRIDGAALEQAILWAVQRTGLPPLPAPPRTRDEQWAVCRAALNGPLRSTAGWGHCVEPNWPRRPFADAASTLWRLTGRVPDLPQLVPGGAHVRNDAIYFVTARAHEWLELQTRRIDTILRGQQPDGSFRYSGKYRRGHFEDTASGLCARSSAELLEFAYQTGHSAACAGGLRGLDYMRRFRTPRGAQTWELSLHTPDLLASAHLVRAYVRGYQLTGDGDYLRAARKWALAGVPFVYQWQRYPVMAYATTAVLGSTNWRAPLWIGLPVQWVGGVYAYALTILAPHDKTLDWNHLARGILIAAEQMQYPEAENIGLLPDSLTLHTQRRNGPKINPCALVSLRMALDGQLDSLAVATAGRHRVVAPFPITVCGDQIVVHAERGVQYQILIDGQRVLTVESQGDDTVRL